MHLQMTLLLMIIFCFCNCKKASKRHIASLEYANKMSSHKRKGVFYSNHGVQNFTCTKGFILSHDLERDLEGLLYLSLRWKKQTIDCQISYMPLDSPLNQHVLQRCALERCSQLENLARQEPAVNTKILSEGDNKIH